MAHNEQRDFCRSVKQILPSYFNNTMVLDIGSLDINGSNQFLFDDCLYIGVDVAEGRNVDLITTGHQLMLPDASVDVIISTECFEHDQFYDKTLKNIFRMLKPGGLFLFTCATTGRPEHGTRRTSPQDAPLLQGLGDWSDYYKNLTESDIREVLDIEVAFSKYAFSIHHGTHDLYFYGVKSGVFNGRNNYSFLVSEKQQQIQNILNERTSQITSLNETLNERTSQITSLNEALNECTGQITSLNGTLSERAGQITSLSTEFQAVRQLVSVMEGTISWRVTKPLRVLSGFVRRIKNEFQMKHLHVLIIVRARLLKERVEHRMISLLQKIAYSTQNELAHNQLVRHRYLTNSVNRETRSSPAIDLTIVTYNSEKWLDKFFNSLLNQSYPISCINLIVVDHGSKDGTVFGVQKVIECYQERFASISLIQQSNLGFGAGHHRAISAGSSEFCLVSNIDLEFSVDAIKNVVEFACIDASNVAAWEFRQIPYEHPKHYDPVTLETNWQSHACIFIRRSAYESVGGYDKEIFMYCEDVELSYRFRSHGYILRYCPSSVVAHYSYESENVQEGVLLKPLQYVGSTVGNAAVRLRYGNAKDRVTAFLALLWLIIRKEQPFIGARLSSWNNLKSIIKKAHHFLAGKGSYQSYYPFRFFDYEMIRFGATYVVGPMKNEDSLVSIITRTYESSCRAMLLEQAARSVAAQTYRKIEWIVVQDGGSSMRALVDKIQADWPHLSVRFIECPKNGRSYAGNQGLAAAQGEFCMFLDDDDLLYSDHVEILVGELVRQPKASAAYALSFEVVSGFEGEQIKETLYLTPSTFHQVWDYTVLQHHNFIPIQSIVFKRQLFCERGGFDLTLDQLEDWNLWLRYGYKNDFVFVPKTTSIFRTPAENNVRTKRHLVLHAAYDDAFEKASELIKSYSK